MLYLLPTTAEDRAAVRTRPVQAGPPLEDLRHLVVRKPWGHEFLCHETRQLAAWCLHLRAGASTSLHCHRDKTTSLVVLSGQVVCRNLGPPRRLCEGEAITIEPGAFHALYAELPSLVVELESPADKADLVRLDDEHGRTGRPYEGGAAYEREELHRYEHFWLSATSPLARHGQLVQVAPSFQANTSAWLAPCVHPVQVGSQPIHPGQVTLLHPDQLAEATVPTSALLFPRKRR